MEPENIFDQVFLGASLQSWLIALVSALLVAALWGLLRHRISSESKEKAGEAIAAIKRRAQERRQQTRQIRQTLTGSTLRITVFTLVVWIGLELQGFPADVTIWSRKIAFIVLMIQIGVWGEALLRYMFSQPGNRRLAGGFKILARTFLWLVVVLVALENLGVDISTALTGLGITGVAVALATQRILGDVLAFLSITYDRPFDVGDFLVVGDDSGTVEEITLRSTRLRALSGESLVISNSDLLSTRIHNYQTLGERRVVITIGVVRETPHAQLAEIPGIVSGVIEDVRGAKLDRVHLHELSESAFDYEVVYYILTPDYNIYMDIREKINLEVVRQFEEKGIRLALPIHQVRVLDDRDSPK